jgi:quinol monooxygenase YgiN
MSLYGTARFSVKPEALDRCRSAIEEFVTYVRGNEPGTKLYLSLQDAEEPTRFLHWMIFEDEAAENIHTNSAAVDRFTGTLYPETVDGVIFERFSPVGPA